MLQTSQMCRLQKESQKTMQAVQSLNAHEVLPIIPLTPLLFFYKIKTESDLFHTLTCWQILIFH